MRASLCITSSPERSILLCVSKANPATSYESSYRYPSTVQISGPNHGRNTSSKLGWSCTQYIIDDFSDALSISSGTLGAAFASSLSGVRSIALSYGIVTMPIPTTLHNPAFELSSKIINHLIDNWSPHDTRLLYSINIPMVEKLLHGDGMKVYWTSAWKSNYGRMFTEVPRMADSSASDVETTLQRTPTTRSGCGNSEELANASNLAFRFKPDYSALLSKTAPPEGSDSWALNVDAASVTPYLTSFAELPDSEQSFSCLQDREWRFKL